MLKEIQNAMILSPHTDDGEFGCGGTIVRLIEKKIDVYMIVFSIVKKPMHDMKNNILEYEFKNSIKTLGIINYELYDYDVRNFPLYRQNILETLINLEKKIKPDIVFLPSTYDTHQDHQVISQEGFRAFKRCSLLGYEIPWNNLTFVTNCFVHLDISHVKKKLDALQCYVSQIKKERKYISEEFLKSLASVRGLQCGAKYAEVFEVIRWIM